MERTLYLGSVSAASRAKRLLSEEHIRARIGKTDSSAEGCAWGLFLKDEDYMDALRILRTNGVRYEVL